MKQGFDQVWKRIRSLEGNTFETETGYPFTYEMKGESVLPSRTKYQLGKKNFETAYEQFPLDGPGPIITLVRG